MKKSTKLILFIIIIMILLPMETAFAQQEADTASTTDKIINKRKSKAKILGKINIGNLTTFAEYRSIVKRNKAVIIVKSDSKAPENIIITDIKTGNVIGAYFYINQIIELNNPNFILVSMYTKNGENPGDTYEDRKVEIPNSLPYDLSEYKNSIIKIDINSGEKEVIIDNCDKIITEADPEYNIKEKYIDYIPTINTFVYKGVGELLFYNLNTGKIKSLSLSKYNYEYISKIEYLGAVAILNTTGRGLKELLIYDIFGDKMFKAGEGVSKFDIMEGYENKYFYTIFDSKAILFISRPSDTNRDGFINKLDKSKLYITYLDTKARHLIQAGSIQHIQYYGSCDYISLVLKEDTNNDNVIDYLDEDARLYLYNSIKKERVKISRNGEIVEYIENFKGFLYYSYDRDTDRDGQKTFVDEPTTLLWSIQSNKIIKIADYKVLYYEIFDENSLIYYLQTDKGPRLYRYNNLSEDSTLIAENMMIEEYIPEINSMIFRRSESYARPSNSELFVYDLDTNKLESLGRDYTNLENFMQQSEATLRGTYYHYLIPESVFLMIKQSAILEPSGNMSFANDYSFVIYDTKENLKRELNIDGKIVDYSYIEETGDVILNFKDNTMNDNTYLIDITSMKTINIGTGMRFVGVTGDNNRYLYLYKTEEDGTKSLYIYDKKENLVQKINKGIEPLNYENESNMSYMIDDQIVYLINFDNNYSLLYYISDDLRITEIGSFNKFYTFDEKLNYFILINQVSDSQASLSILVL